MEYGLFDLPNCVRPAEKEVHPSAVLPGVRDGWQRRAWQRSATTGICCRRECGKWNGGAVSPRPSRGREIGGNAEGCKELLHVVIGIFP